MKTPIYVGLIAASLAALLLGCVSTSFQADPSHTAGQVSLVSPSAVRVLRSLPAQPYQALGRIEASVSGHHSSEAILLKVRKAAAAVGANAIVADPAGTLFAEPSRQEMDSVSPEASSYTFIALRLPDPSSASR